MSGAITRLSRRGLLRLSAGTAGSQVIAQIVSQSARAQPILRDRSASWSVLRSPGHRTFSRA